MKRNKLDQVLLQINISRQGLAPVRIASTNPETANAGLFVLRNISKELNALMGKIELLKVRGQNKF